MTIFRAFRQLPEAIEALVRVLTDVVDLQRSLGPALVRLEKLELSRHQFEAECEGMLLKADGKLKAASSAEARERQLKKANERLADPFDPDSEAQPDDPVRPFDASKREAQGVPAVHLDLARNSKAHAQRAKWGT